MLADQLVMTAATVPWHDRALRDGVDARLATPYAAATVLPKTLRGETSVRCGECSGRCASSDGEVSSGERNLLNDVLMHVYECDRVGLVLGQSSSKIGE